MDNNKIIKILGITGAALAVIIAVVSLFDDPQRQLVYSVQANESKNSITPQELSSWIIEGRRDFVILDMRKVEKYRAGHIRGAVSCPACHAWNAGTKEAKKFEHPNRSQINLSKTIVLYDDFGDKPITVPKVIKDNPRLLGLKGGYEAWKTEVMNEVVFKAEDSEEDVLAKKKKDAVRNFYLGKTITAPKVDFKPAATGKKGHKSAGADEGC